MKPAKRTQRIDLSGIRKMFELVGENSINLGLGEPDFDTPLHIREAAKMALDEGFTHYTVNKGIPELREAVSSKLKDDNHINTDPESIIITVGASEALFMCMQALINPGDEVILPDPGFVSYDACVTLSGGRSVPVELPEDHEYRMLPERVLDQITPKTKAIIMNSPSNPTGGVLKKEDVKGVAQIAYDHDLALVSDEIYEKIIYEGKHYSPARFNQYTITINGFSKAYAMTGFRVAYVATQGEIIEDLLKVHQYSTACASSISQKAALAALTGPQDSIGEMVNEFRRRRDLVIRRLEEMGIHCNTPHGAFYVLFPVVNPNYFVLEALKRDVILVPGNSFGSYGEGHVRLSYATAYQQIEEAMDRIQEI